MEKHFLKFSMVSIATAIVLSTGGCSGGSSSNDSTPTSIVNTGTAIDGILQDSTVCIDADSNEICSSNEANATTDIDGNFTITSTSTGNLLVLGGNDSGTGLPFTGSLKAPSGSSVITPLTSAIQAMIEGGSSQAQAEIDIKKALGIDANVTLTTFNPLDLIENGSDSQKTQAQDILASQAQLQTLVHAASATLAGAGTGTTTTIANSMDNVFKEIVKNFDGATTEITITPTMLATATKAVADEVYVGNTAAKVAVKSVANSAATSAVDTATTTKAAIEDATVTSATSFFNNAIIAANTTLQNDVNASAAGAKTATDDVNSTQLNLIADAQKLQQEEEAKIAAATVAAEKAAADLAAAKTAAEADAQNKAKYDAYLAAIAEDQRKAAAQKAAEAAAAEAAAEAAKLEVQLKEEADRAAALAKAEAELLAVQQKAAADAAAAAARIAAADAAAAAAKATANIAAAIAAAATADLSASINIAKLDVNVSANNANASVKSAENDLNATITLGIDNDISLDANITTATNAVNGAKVARDIVLSIQTSIANVSDSAVAKQHAINADNNATVAANQAKIAADALAAAKNVLINMQLAKIDTEAKARIAAAITASRLIVINADSNATAEFSSASSSAYQTSADANETIAIAAAYTSSTTAQTEKTKAIAAATAAKTALDLAHTAKGTIASLKILVSDANVTQINAEKYAIEASATIKTLQAEVAKVKIEADKAKAALSAIKVIKNNLDIATSKTAAASNLVLIQASATAANASATAARTSATAAGTIATTNSNASAYASAAAYAATSAENFAAQATQLLNAAITHKASTDTATDARVAATEAGYVQIKVAPAAEAATGAADQATLAATALASAKNAKVPIVVNGGIVAGMSFINFDEDNGQIEVGKNTLSNGTLTEERYIFDKSTGNFNITTKSPHFVLTTAGWVIDTNNDYNLSNGTAIFSDMQVRIAKTIDLTTLSTESALAMQEISKFLPTDINVTFSDGAEAYILAFKKAESYRLGWMPTNWETNASYTSIIDYMNAGENPAGVNDATGNWNGVYFQTQAYSQTQAINTAPIDINGNVVTTLTEGLEGNLTAKEFAIIVGKWSVIKLSNNDLALLITPKVGSEGYFGNQFDNLLAVVDGSVYQGEYITTNTDFVEDNSSIEFSDVAYENIKNFIKDYVISQNSRTDGGFTSQMLTSAPLYTVTLPIDGTSAYYCDVNYSANGTVSVSINGNSAQTFNYTLSNGEVHLPDNTYARLSTNESNATVAIISVFNSDNVQIANRLGFMDKSARDAYFSSLSGASNSGIYDFSGLVGQTIYFENANGVFGMRTFNADNTTTGIVSTSGVYDGNYTTHDNIVSITTLAGTTNIVFAEQPTFSHLSDFNVSVNGTASNWKLASPIPSMFLNQEISFLSSNGGHGTRTFNDKGIVSGLAGLAGQTAIPYTSGYMYDPSTGNVYIRDGISTIVITLPSNNNLSALPVTKITDATGAQAQFTVAWTLPTTTVIEITADMLTGKVFYDDFNDSAYGNTIYGKMTIETNSTITRHEIALDSNKTVVDEWTINFPYTLLNGVIAVDAGGIKTFTLHSTTDTTWYLTDENNSSIVWNITDNIPSGYPSNL